MPIHTGLNNQANCLRFLYCVIKRKRYYRTFGTEIEIGFIRYTFKSRVFFSRYLNFHFTKIPVRTAYTRIIDKVIKCFRIFLEIVSQHDRIMACNPFCKRIIRMINSTHITIKRFFNPFTTMCRRCFPSDYFQLNIIRNSFSITKCISIQSILNNCNFC